MRGIEAVGVGRLRVRRNGARLHRTLLSALLAVTGLPLLAATAEAQAVRLGVMMESARESLAVVWTEDPQQSERAYCVTDWHRGVTFVSRLPTIKTDTIYRVFGVADAAVTEADPSSIDFECPPGVPELHTHTPTTCTGDDARTCFIGGPNAYSCQPSRQDLEKLVRRGDPFAIVQCDRYSFRFYYPSDYGPPAMRTASFWNSSKPDSRGNITAAGTGYKP